MSSKHIDTVIDHVNKEMRFLAREVEFVVPECLQDSSACEIMFIWRHAWLLVVNRTVVNIDCNILAPMLMQCVLHHPLLRRDGVLIALLYRLLLKHAHVVNNHRIFDIIWMNPSLIECRNHIEYRCIRGPCNVMYQLFLIKIGSTRLNSSHRCISY